MLKLKGKRQQYNDDGDKDANKKDDINGNADRDNFVDDNYDDNNNTK